MLPNINNNSLELPAGTNDRALVAVSTPGSGSMRSGGGGALSPENMKKQQKIIVADRKYVQRERGVRKKPELSYMINKEQKLFKIFDRKNNLIHDTPK